MKTQFYFLHTAPAAFNPFKNARVATIQQLSLQSIYYSMFRPGNSILQFKKLLVICMVAIFFSNTVLADYTIASGTTVNASSISSQGGVLTVNGRLNVDLSTVSLLNFTRVVIDGADAQIFWAGNNDLKFAAGISFVISNTSLGLQPTTGNGNASTRLYIGTAIIAVSSDNSNNAAFSFELFNYIGGLPDFTLTTSSSSICNGAALTATLTPLSDKINYDCSWTVSPSAGTSIIPSPGSSFTNFSQAQTFIFSYPNTPQTYTLSCSINRADAGIAFISKSVNVSVNPIPALPTSVTASPGSICAGSSTNINATEPAGNIQWYTAGSGGIVIGSSASEANFSVSPIVNTTYYAEAKDITTGCTSASRIPVAITVSQPPVGGSITGSGNVCSGNNNISLTLRDYSGTIQWQSSTDNNTFININGSTAPGFTATNLTSTTYYRTLLSSGVCPSTTSSVATIPVSPVSVAGTISGAQSVCTGTNSTLLTLAGNTGTIQWQSSTDNGSFSNIAGATASTFTATNLTVTTYYRVVVVSGSCASVIGLPVAITVIPASVGGTAAGGMGVCLGPDNTNLTLSNHVGNIVKWQTSPSIDFSNNVADIANSSPTLTTTSISAATFYRAVVTTGCDIAYSAPAIVTIHNLWTGKVSADWNTAANWADSVLPSVSCPDVTIPAGTPFAPVLNSGTATIHNLVIPSGASLTVGSARLQISGAITNAGTFNAGNGSLDFTGSSTQTISGNTIAGNTLKNLTISNNLVVDNTPGNFLNITGELAFGDVDDATLNTGDNIVLISTAEGTARVADITNNGVNTGNKIIGKVTIQRYLTARRVWRLFTAPLSHGGSIFDNWQNAGVYQPGKGTYVSGPGASSPTGSDGLDWSPLNNASLKTGASLVPVLNTRTARLSRNLADTSDNIPYFIFTRGDRNPVNTNAANKNTTSLSSVGKLQTGRQTFTASSIAGALTLIGNPYASPVDMAKIEKHNVYNRFYVWDPNLNTELGGYVVFDDINNTGTYSYTASNLTPVLQSGQAFFVTTINNGPASIVFRENNKTAGNNLLAYRSSQRSVSFRTNLYHLNENNATILLDGTLALFDNNFNRETDQQDALKVENVKEMVALKRDYNSLAIERRPIVAGEDTLYLQLMKTIPRSYRLGFEPANLDTNLTAFLKDSYTGENMPLSTVAASVYDFDITADENSIAPDRFMIIFKQAAEAQLPVSRSITAYQQGDNVMVQWMVKHDINASRYEVERSADGVNFTKVNSTTPMTANSDSATYHWLDENPLTGDNYYRIRSIVFNGNFEYTNAVLVKTEHTITGIGVYPNPIADGVINIEFKNTPAGVYNIRLLSNAGQTMLSKTITHTAGSWKESIQPGYKLKHGIYQLEITAAGKQIAVINVIVK